MPSSLDCIADLQEENARLRWERNRERNSKYADVATALYTFAGWLTTRSGTLKVGSGDNAAPMADLVDLFCKANLIPDPEMADSPFRHPEEAAREAGEEG